MATKIKKNIKRHANSSEPSSVYLLKLVLYLIIGVQWLRLENSAGNYTIPIPIGLIIGLLFASHEHFRIDRKIEFAVLLVATLVGYFAATGFYITY